MGRHTSFFGATIGFLFTSLMCVGLMAPANAESENRLIEAYHAGEYLWVAEQAMRTGEAADKVLAARALLTEYVVTAPDDLTLVHRAEGLARAALTEKPEDPDARFQLAVALSMKLRLMSLGEAQKSGEGEEARDLVEAILDEDPDNAWAHSYLSVWHVEVRRRAGAMGAMVVGASTSKAEQHYRQAVTIMPEDSSFHYQYARVLLALDAKRYREEAKIILETALANPNETALAKVVKARADELHKLLEATKPDWRVVSQRARQLL